METMIKPSQLDNGHICFLLDIEYQGTPFRFSTIPIDLEDTANNTIVKYQGGLNDPDIIEKTSFLGVDMEAGTVPIELVFQEIDWVEEWLAGRMIDNSKATISMIIISEGKTQFTLEDRVGLFAGKCISGIFGEPTKLPGYIAFSIENNSIRNPKNIILESQAISRAEFPDCQERAIGKFAPFVYGKLGPYPYQAGTGTQKQEIEWANDIKGSPTYSIENDSLFEKYIICYGLVSSTNIRVWESTGGNFVNPIETALDSEGRIYSYVQYNVLGPNIEDNSFVPVANENDEYWAQWSEYGGSILNPLGDGYLSGAGDICLFFLAESGLEYNHNAWVGLRAILNKYKFAGYINDPEISYWDYLEQNIIRWLPIEVINGSQGLEPRLNLYFHSQEINPSHHVEESGEFDVITGIQPLEQEILNHLTINFAISGINTKYKSKVVIDPALAPRDETSIKFNHPLAKTSLDRYGIYQETIEIPNLYDLETAYQIARDMIRIRALGAYGIEIQADPKYGYIQLGDILAFSSDRLGFQARKCQVVSKSWQDGRWHFVIHLEDNKLINP